ncbi:right-handed parallel beta-helix repeat-containing protein [Azospirillum sp. SYSU D00513]|uniref:right-handed parallel beta-helix repeat-containing protein n=1 Tax=Azospirillum sp. SYSU D00513 TaxID=2812561 RepID=UPI001A956E01|nr:right-handed parallel beta-helix repeat-containing protein [Azospirillum sp. SYSU D00513]
MAVRFYGMGTRAVRAALFAAALLGLGTAPALAQRAAANGTAAGAAVHVSPRGDDRWSGRAAEPGRDGRDGPVATLARAVDLARRGGLRTILLRSGTYRIEETVELGPEDEGLRIAAYPGERPVLSGGERIGGFAPEKGAERAGVFSAPLAQDPGLDLTVGGVRLRPAQSGDLDPADPVRTGWLVAQAAKGGASKRRLRFAPGSLQAGWAAPGVRVQALDRERLSDSIIGVEAIDAARGTLTLEKDAQYAFRDGSTFRLLGHPDFLKHPGQFAWDARRKRLLVRPAEPDSFAGEAVVARVAPLIQLDRTRGVTIEGLGFTEVPYDGPALRVEGGGGHAVLNNHFNAVGTAVTVEASTGNLIRGNLMEHLGRTGVSLRPGSDDNRVVANRMRHIGEVALFSAGVFVSGAQRTLVAHNDIRHSSRYGVSVKNWSEETVNTDTVIEYNRIQDTARETADAGAIETLGRSNIDTRTVIRFNDIRDTGGIATNAAGKWLERYKGFGIYLDDQTNGVRVESNFLMNTGWAAVFIHGGDHNRVHNNISVLTQQRDRFLRLEWVPKAGVAGFLRDNVITHNIVHARAPMDQFWVSLTGGEPVIDNNIVDRAYGNRAARAAAPARTEARTIQGPQLSNPYFINPGRDDFRLRDNSQARALGIADLPWNRIGPEGAE